MSERAPKIVINGDERDPENTTIYNEYPEQVFEDPIIKELTESLEGRTRKQQQILLDAFIKAYPEKGAAYAEVINEIGKAAAYAQRKRARIVRKIHTETGLDGKGTREIYAKRESARNAAEQTMSLADLSQSPQIISANTMPRRSAEKNSSEGVEQALEIPNAEPGPEVRSFPEGPYEGEPHYPVPAVYDPGLIAEIEKKASAAASEEARRMEVLERLRNEGEISPEARPVSEETRALLREKAKESDKEAKKDTANGAEAHTKPGKKEWKDMTIGQKFRVGGTRAAIGAVGLGAVYAGGAILTSGVYNAFGYGALVNPAGATGWSSFLTPQAIVGGAFADALAMSFIIYTFKNWRTLVDDFNPFGKGFGLSGKGGGGGGGAKKAGGGGSHGGGGGAHAPAAAHGGGGGAHH